MEGSRGRRRGVGEGGYALDGGTVSIGGVQGAQQDWHGAHLHERSMDNFCHAIVAHAAHQECVVHEANVSNQVTRGEGAVHRIVQALGIVAISVEAEIVRIAIRARGG